MSISPISHKIAEAIGELCVVSMPLVMGVVIIAVLICQYIANRRAVKRLAEEGAGSDTVFYVAAKAIHNHVYGGK